MAEEEKGAVAEEVRIGRVTHYFGKIGVAAVELSDGDLSVGDTIRIRGHTSDLTLSVGSMQIDRVEVAHAEKGQSVGIRVPERARVGDEVFRLAS